MNWNPVRSPCRYKFSVNEPSTKKSADNIVNSKFCFGPEGDLLWVKWRTSPSKFTSTFTFPLKRLWRRLKGNFSYLMTPRLMPLSLSFRSWMLMPCWSGQLLIKLSTLWDEPRRIKTCNMYMTLHMCDGELQIEKLAYIQKPFLINSYL